jgi:uncharacterized protein
MIATLLFVQATIPDRLIASARDQLTWGTTYDPTYTSLKYPGGDVDRKVGVCTDVIIRSFRAIHLDLQKLIIEHKRSNMGLYPKGKLDPNIDHRRVKNMAVFFKARKASLPLNTDWKPGDVVYWKLDSGLDHVGLVTNTKGHSGLFQVIHNMSTPKEEDVLTTWKIVGHYRFPK